MKLHIEQRVMKPYLARAYVRSGIPRRHWRGNSSLLGPQEKHTQCYSNASIRKAQAGKVSKQRTGKLECLVRDSLVLVLSCSSVSQKIVQHQPPAARKVKVHYPTELNNSTQQAKSQSLSQAQTLLLHIIITLIKAPFITLH